MTLGALVEMVRELLSDDVNWVPTTDLVSGQTWDAGQYQDAVNFAIKVYCQKKRITYTEEARAISAGYVSLPSDRLDVQRVVYENTELVKSNLDFEYLKDPTWTSTVGTPKRWVAFSGTTLALTPKMTTWSTTVCTIGYHSMPDLLSSSASEIDARVPLEQQEYLKYAAASYLLQFKTDQESTVREQSYMNMFNQLIGAA